MMCFLVDWHKLSIVDGSTAIERTKGRRRKTYKHKLYCQNDRGGRYNFSTGCNKFTYLHIFSGEKTEKKNFIVTLATISFARIPNQRLNAGQKKKMETKIVSRDYAFSLV